MHNHNENNPAQTGFEPGTSRLQAPVDTNEPSGQEFFPGRFCRIILYTSYFLMPIGQVLLCTVVVYHTFPFT